MGRFVVAAYRPKLGKQDELISLLKKHMRVLDAENLVTDRPAYIMRAMDGTMVEVFEWKSSDAIERAHASPAIQALWSEFEIVSDYVPLASLSEATALFAEFASADEVISGRQEKT